MNYNYGITIQSAESVHCTKLYATMAISDNTIATARLVESSTDHPIWDQSFRVYYSHFSPSVIISVCVQIDVAFPSVLGRVTVPASQFLAGMPVQGWFDLFHEEGNKLANTAQVRTAALK
ncbi:hypothetical protein ZIOFF_000727 [Zingiber officinale]|uniref:C2 domain-containing protein n=1 Tax=Zingiber officinale TaxID=94328 RepID=A0A8J5I4V5_ZINOF|nr:hypothetical protein ZIOFF_000727 [Zingiber officinale]